MTATKIKTLLLILLICVLAGMLLALGSPDTLSAGITALSQPAKAAGSAAAQSVTGTPDVTAAAAEATAAQSATSQATVAPAAAKESEDEQRFTAIETVYISPDLDRWTYSSPELAIEVSKVVAAKPEPLVYYTAEVWMRDQPALRSCFAADDVTGKTRLPAAEIARQSQAVLAVTADGFTQSKNRKGVLIRRGKPVLDQDRADTLAVLPDGALAIYAPGEADAEALLALGVQDAYSCGPALVRAGAIDKDLANHRRAARAARAGVGMIGRGHWVFIVVDGCDKRTSVGATLPEYAALFRMFRCEAAYNLQGGGDAAICFMGRQLNGLSGGKRTKMADVIAGGRSKLGEREEPAQ